MSAAIVVYKSLTLAAKVSAFAKRFGKTSAFIESRDEIFRGWTAETAGRLDEFIHLQREALLLVGASLEDYERKLEEILEHPELQVLAALYGEAAYREALEERRLMLEHAAATIVDANLTMTQKCRAEKVLHALDPDDVLELDRVHRVAGLVQRKADGKGLYHFDEDRHRWRVLTESSSADALLSAECVRFENGKWGGPTAIVTSRGRVILHILRSYVPTRRRPAPGREVVPGERGQVIAFAAMTPDFRSIVIRAAAHARFESFDLSQPMHLRSYRIQFDFPKPTLDAKNQELQPITEPAPDKSARLHIWPLPDEMPAALKAAAPAGIEVTVLPGQGYGSVQINGPFDVLRWLAEEIDAWWT